MRHIMMYLLTYTYVHVCMTLLQYASVLFLVVLCVQKSTWNVPELNACLQLSLHLRLYTHMTNVQDIQCRGHVHFCDVYAYNLSTFGKQFKFLLFARDLTICDGVGINCTNDILLYLNSNYILVALFSCQ